MTVLEEALDAAGIVLESDALAALLRYAEYVLAANAAQNLTALRSPALFAAEGVVDSLRAWAAIGVEDVQSVLDVGSGSGLPALVWLCAGKAASGTLVEAERRKTEFLRSAAADLGLPVDVVWGRAEELAHGPMRDGAQLVTARAVAPAPIAIEVAGGLVRPGGLLALLKGRRADEEALAGRAVAARMGFAPAQIHPYELPGGVVRAVLLYRKLRSTPAGRPTGFARLRREFPTKPATAGER
ncbi:MAG: class I SAM-dependent methyltransferase [Thermaerobacter sp.]|nr:class I SAM-dependent methyltransferase [Thermaerobacter sp.]